MLMEDVDDVDDEGDGFSGLVWWAVRVVSESGGEEQEEGRGSRAVRGELHPSRTPPPPPVFRSPGAADDHLGEPSSFTPGKEEK